MILIGYEMKLSPKLMQRKVITGIYTLKRYQRNPVGKNRRKSSL